MKENKTAGENADLQILESRLAEIEKFVEAINKLPNPFVYELLHSQVEHPDIPINIVPQFA